MSRRIGIVASAHRPQNWMDLYKSIGDNDIEFELVFVGPNHPDYELPRNFRFIRTDVKPTQCFEIAVRNTTADLVMHIADDCEFNTPQPLDRLYELYKSCNSDKLIVSSRMMTNGKDQSHFAHRFCADDGTIIVFPVCGLMSKKFYRDHGGIDKNFIAVMWDLDIAMRVYALGGRVVMSDVYINEDKGKSAGSDLCNEYWGHDRTLLENLWITNGKFLLKENLWTNNGKFHLNRKYAVESFSDVNILNASQGPRGRWRGNGPVFVEKVEDHLRRYSSILGRVNRGIRKPSMYVHYAKRMVLRLRNTL